MALSERDVYPRVMLALYIAHSEGGMEKASIRTPQFSRFRDFRAAAVEKLHGLENRQSTALMVREKRNLDSAEPTCTWHVPNIRDNVPITACWCDDHAYIVRMGLVESVT